MLIGWLAARGKSRELTPDLESNPGVNYLRYFYLTVIGPFTHAFTLALGLLLKRSTFKRFQPDCVLVSWAFPDGVAGVALAKSLGVPAVIKVHGTDINMHLLHPLRAKQIRWAMNNSAAVVSVSNALASKIVELGIPKSKIITIYNGIDHSVFFPQDQAAARAKLGLDPGRKLILYIGNLKHEKGCVDLAQAFTAIKDTVENVDLYYIGTGKEASTIDALAAEYNVGNRVHVLGGMTHQELLPWITASDLVSLPSHNEGVPNVLLEAMACGKPVVATRVGGIPEVVQPEAGILVPAEDQDALQQALVQAVNRNWDSAAISKTVEDFDWDNNTQRLYDLLKNVCQKHDQLAGSSTRAS